MVSVLRATLFWCITQALCCWEKLMWNLMGFSCSVNVPDWAWRGEADLCRFLLPMKRWTQNWIWKKRMTYGLCTSPLYLDGGPWLGRFKKSITTYSSMFVPAFLLYRAHLYASYRENWTCWRWLGCLRRLGILTNRVRDVLTFNEQQGWQHWLGSNTRRVEEASSRKLVWVSKIFVFVKKLAV